MSKDYHHVKSNIENKAVGFPLETGVFGRPGSVETIESGRTTGAGASISWAISEYVVGPIFLIISGSYTYLTPNSISTRAHVREAFQRAAKRSLDICGCLLGIVIATPLFLILPILIKLDSEGPAFYSQVRVGYNRRRRSRRAYGYFSVGERRRRDRRREDFKGSLFRVYKFRTMISDAEKLSGPIWATKDDPRMTRVGRLLRRSRLDELPQLLNVFMGDMSLVGPRPERPIFVRELSVQIEDYDRRLSVKPGITGLAQVENGYDSSVHSVTEKLRCDLRYIDNWSLGMDVRILIRTIRVVLTGHGAH